MDYSLSGVAGPGAETLEKALQGPNREIQHRIGKMKPGSRDADECSALGVGELAESS